MEWEDDGFAVYLTNELGQNTVTDEHEIIEMDGVACLYDMLGDMLGMLPTCVCSLCSGWHDGLLCGKKAVAEAYVKNQKESIL